VFIAIAIWHGVSMAGLFGCGAMAAAGFSAVGGFLKGLGAESKIPPISGQHYQLFHLAAVVVISFGACVLMSSIATKTGLAVPWQSPEVQRWLQLLALAGSAMILPAHFVKRKEPKQ